MTTTLTLPALDENIADYTVIKWLKHPGDVIAINDPLLEVETDKVTMEVGAELAGTLLDIIAKPGMVIHPGGELATLQREGTQSERTARCKTQRLTPVVARLVAEHNLDLSQLTGTGSQGRVTKKDVLAFLSKQEQVATQPDVSQPAPTPASVPIISEPTNGLRSKVMPHTGMRRSIAAHMVQSVQTSPHVTTVFEIDFSVIDAHRAAQKAAFASEGIKLTYMAYIMQATAKALKKYPQVNSSWHDDGLILHSAVNIGLIVAVDGGVVAPVVFEADQLNLRGLAKRIETVAQRGRQGQLTPDEMKEGTFCISNHGASGSLWGTPIIFQPQAGILGIGTIEERVKVINGGIHIKPCAYVSFSFDHRVMDGALADGFVSDIKHTIETWTDP
ncbi:MAG: 2-oxo acid dehydrogenase subunit E2 [Chloroflexota bacterium]